MRRCDACGREIQKHWTRCESCGAQIERIYRESNTTPPNATDYREQGTHTDNHQSHHRRQRSGDQHRQGTQHRGKRRMHELHYEGRTEPPEDDNEYSRRKLLAGAGIVLLGGVVVVSSGSDSEESSESGFQDPAVAVEEFVNRVQEREYDDAAGILYEDAYEDPLSVVGGSNLVDGNIDNLRTTILDESDDRAEVELLYNDLSYSDPSYSFGSLFYLRYPDNGWLIYDYDGSYIGGGW